MKKSGEQHSSVEGIRINRYLALCGLGSRRKCDEIVCTGRIYCNGIRVKKLGTIVVPGSDRIEYLGNVIKPLIQNEYYAYYKPREILVTKSDPQGRTTLYDALQRKGVHIDHLRYAGRLDYQSEGLLLLTNDGTLIHSLTHPRFHIKKVYHVKIERKVDNGEVASLLNGIVSKGQLLRIGSIRQIPVNEKNRRQYWYEIELFEGKNRQLRRMFESISINVSRIRRIQFGCILLGSLKPGDIRALSQREVRGLRNLGFKEHDIRKRCKA